MLQIGSRVRVKENLFELIYKYKWPSEMTAYIGSIQTVVRIERMTVMEGAFFSTPGYFFPLECLEEIVHIGYDYVTEVKDKFGSIDVLEKLLSISKYTEREDDFKLSDSLFKDVSIKLNQDV